MKYRYGSDVEEFRRGMAVEVLFGVDNGLEWIRGVVEDVDPCGRVVIRRTDGRYASSLHPRSIRIPMENDK